MSSIKLEETDYTETYMNLLRKRWVSPVELEAIYGFKRASQSKMRMSSSSSSIPFSKIGKYVRYDRIAIDKWLENHQVQGCV